MAGNSGHRPPLQSAFISVHLWLRIIPHPHAGAVLVAIAEDVVHLSYSRTCMPECSTRFRALLRCTNPASNGWVVN